MWSTTCDVSPELCFRPGVEKTDNVVRPTNLMQFYRNTLERSADLSESAFLAGGLFSPPSFPCATCDGITALFCLCSCNTLTVEYPKIVLERQGLCHQLCRD
ncbi:unnamed protein product [Ectocarpus fasciculatus]